MIKNDVAYDSNIFFFTIKIAEFAHLTSDSQQTKIRFAY